MSQPQQSTVSSQEAPSGAGEDGAQAAAPGPRGLVATAWSAVTRRHRHGSDKAPAPSPVRTPSPDGHSGHHGG